MRTTMIAASIPVLVFATASLAAPPRLPAAVAKDVEAIAQECIDVGGKADTSKAVQAVDLNGDAKDDYVFDVGLINCDGAASIYGDREKLVTVYVGDAAGGARSAFQQLAYGSKVEGAGPAAKLWLTVSAQNCGKPPARDFASENFCDRYIAWDAKSKVFEFAPVSTVRMIQ